MYIITTLMNKKEQLLLLRASFTILSWFNTCYIGCLIGAVDGVVDVVVVPYLMPVIMTSS